MSHEEAIVEIARIIQETQVKPGRRLDQIYRVLVQVGALPSEIAE